MGILDYVNTSKKMCQLQQISPDSAILALDIRAND